MQRRISTLASIGLMALLYGCGGGGGSGSPAPPAPPPAADTTPDAISFPAQTGIMLSTAVTSPEIVVTGINANATVTITSGEYSIDGGAFTSAAGTVANNQRIRVRVNSSGQFSTPVTATLTVGTVSVAFTATTLDADTTPDAFAFPSSSNLVRGAWATSAPATISGINTTTPVSISGGEYSIAGGAFTSAAGSITLGQTLTVRAQAGTTYSKVTRATVTVGTVNSAFVVVSELPNYVPDKVVFDGTDIVYLLSNANRLIFRWSVGQEHYLDPYTVGVGALNPTSMAYLGAQNRLYLGYSSGAIRRIDVSAAAPDEAPFAITGGVASLGSAGNFLTAQLGTYSYDGGLVINSAGVTTDHGGYYYGYSHETAWDPITSRIYYTRDGISPNDLHYDVIDQTTGLVTSSGETPYHGSYNIQPPIRVSANGQYVLLGSGDIYAQAGLTWSGSLGSQVADAQWLSNGSLVTLTTSGNQTTLRRLASTNLANVEQLTYTGTALRVAGTDTKMAVLVIANNTVRIHTYVPNDDTDGDGVLNTQDAFPLDRAASADTDRDGYPDAWNAGLTQADSTTGLVLDAFPQDSACWLAAHGSGGTCNYGATMPNYTPDAGQVVQNGDIIYLLSSANRRVYRWSIGSGAYLNPYVVGLNQGFTTIAPTKIAYSPGQQRLYLGYATGAIRYIDTAGTSPAEVQFSNTAMGVDGLASVGNYLLAQDGSGAWATHYIINGSGVITDQVEWNYYSREYAWDATTSRVYFLRDNMSPNDLHYEVINQATGEITSAGETPYHGEYGVNVPIRVSVNAQHVLLGTGDLYAQNGLTWSGSLGSPVADARWLANGSLVTLTTNTSQTTLRRLAATTLGTLEQLSFTGQALRVVGSDASMVVLVINNGTVAFHTYVPNDDSDGDGVLNTVDAFPLDRAASVDTDGDGYPTAWNAGRTQADSTTGLTLDAFPNDSACWLSSHGSGGLCNYAATMPNYTPDTVVQHDDIIYLLSSTNRRVYRWSISAGAYLNPYVVGINQGFSTVAPTTMAYSTAHHRLYLGYSTGAIRYIDVNAGPAEVDFANAATAVNGLVSAGNFLLAQASSSYVIDAGGVIVAQGWGYGGSSRDYAWDPVTSRVYYFRDGTSPNDLHYAVINQTTGLITSSGETPYHGAYNIQPPIRVTADGQYVLVGSGDIYAEAGLIWSGSLGSQVTDARWLANGSLVTVATFGNQTTLRRLGANNLGVLEQLSFAGQALRVVGSDTAMVVLTLNNGVVQFYNYLPNNDSDADGVSNTTDAFPLDRAASVDTDHDGYPDAWNPGRSQADSTTGLTLDAFPTDSACWLAAHGSGGLCTYGATIPNYVPDKVLVQGDTVYLLSIANRRVYRWSIATAAYLNPYIIGINQGFATIAPTRMAYSSAHQRLYFGYDTGAIRYIDVNAGFPTEVAFSNTAMAVGGLAAVGNFVLAQDGSGAWATHYIFNSSGVITDQHEWNYSSPEYAWDPVTSRVYFFRDHSPSDMHYEVIDQTTGLISSAGETPYHEDMGWSAPIRVSTDGQQILLGSGLIFQQNGLTLSGSVAANKDAYWKDNLLVDLTTADVVEIRDADSHAVLRSYPYAGAPIALAFGTSEAYLVHVVSNTTAFVRLPFYDQDADSIPRWWEQTYGLSDTSAADATTDLDADGVNNRDEYLNDTNPTIADTDGDGLNDFQEIVTYTTNPLRRDTDGEGLSDSAEVDTHNTDPNDPDSDDDSYTDLDEVLYGGDANDASELPQPLTNYSQTFEAGANLAAWITPTQSGGSWAVDTTLGHAGSRSYKSGSVLRGQRSGVRFRGVFAAGDLTFWSKLDAGYCCNRLEVAIDGVVVLNLPPDTLWTSHTIPVPAGAHDIEWRYQRYDYGGQTTDAGWIDDVVFVGH